MLAVVFAALGVAGWVELFTNIVHHDLLALIAFHAVIAIAASAVAVGSWTMARWTLIAALVYGVATAGLLLSLPPLLKLDPSAGGGLRAGAAIILAFSLWIAWYLRRSSRARGASENRAG